MEREFLLSMQFIFPVLILVSQRLSLYVTYLSILFHRKPILLWILLLYIVIQPKKKDLGREVVITGLIEVTLMGSCIM